MSKNVTIIPPSEKKPDTLRVAAYCRVSSDSSDQLHSYASQIRKYTEEISHHQGWELVDIYADEGLTGTRMEQREDFNRMMADCRKGKIDKVLVKSVSRFARNTKDCLAALRELMSLGVTVYFEKENINTETLTTELMVSVSGALAQQESISTSQNQRISYKRRMERGEFITCKAPYGYRIKDDCVIIAGDFGGIWDGSAEERHWLDWLEAKPFTTLFVSGNHENFDMLAEFPTEDWHGGKVQRIRPSMIHLLRGQIYDIQGKTFFTMGGASSHDIQDGILEPDDPLFKKKCRRLDARGAMYRVNHRSWWKEELPSEEEYQTARSNLDRAGWAVDYIISHCCPISVQDELSGGFYRADGLTDFLEEVAHRCRFKYHFFGHYHTNQVIREKYVLLYEQIIRLKE